MTAPLPLTGVRVVECASYVAGPSGGMGLARLGADVIRVDPIGGAPDVTRWPLAPSGTSLYWTGLNKGKRSVELNLTTDEGKELLAALIAAPGPESGLLLHNRAGRDWLSDDVLRAHRPDLIHLAVQGRRDGSPALDYTVNATTGIPYLTGSGTTAVNHTLPAWDLITGSHAATALLAALWRRQRTGEGAHLRIALEDVAITSVADLGWLAEAQLGAPRQRDGNYVFGTYGDVLTTRDNRHVMVMAMTPRQWQALQTATGTQPVFDALTTTLRIDLSTEDGRYANRRLISSVLQRWFTDHDLPKATAALDNAGALHAPYNTIGELAATLEAEHTTGSTDSIVTNTDQPGIGPVLTARSPIRWDDTAARPAPTAPHLGADTATVLSGVLGLSDTHIAALIAKGIAGGTPP
ncbi:2-methylfumaryl-CoA isomerase [Prauserella marina]|uniref:2-methylfumaryl-CoA isomerase n=1 Tax=Prauserella marina TaxID=530584 RepID=A0A1G6R5E0_9PSEU|nr:CoA transferase [Prauserella marina]PWV76856.1 2-methylfumaryl-CoA isomerase [Prauserella marina]SDC99116.1 2-methylfumaryl-CoA isomerase [Prauserella marina]